MNRFQNRKIALAVAVALLTPMVLRAQAEKETLVVEEVTVNKGIEGGNTAEFDQILGTLKGSLTTSLQKKFKILSRAQLKKLLEEQSLSGDVKLTPAKYILATTITGFSDGSATNPGEAGTARTRTIKIFGTVEILKLSGETFANTDFSVSKHVGRNELPGVVRDMKFGDELVEQVPKEAANQIAVGVFYSICPPRVTDVTGKQVTIDWGDGLVGKGDKLKVFALKIKENADPVEIEVGDVEINRVTPKTSTGFIVGENLGIVEGCVLRKPQ